MKDVYVYLDGPDPALLGILHFENSGKREIASFEYDENYISNNFSSPVLGPDIHPYSGRQYAADGRLFGIISDSCPDRWGRTLMMRKEALLARAEGRKPRTLLESDYLLGVYDLARSGALRFKLEEDGEFLEAGTGESAAPPWINLRELESAAYAVDANGEYDEKYIRQLIAPGSSLGGARPKANVTAPDGSIWIAKFPAKNDDIDVGAWEKVANDLAKMCGIIVPETQLLTLSSKGSTFLSKRFDRQDGLRIHFASAMTMLEQSDGNADGISYLDIASVIRSYSINAANDLKELWKRMVFNILISNTDDHLRNHGFLMKGIGWTLSPVYDINPVPYGNNLSLNISENDSSLDCESALETSRYYGIKENDAKEMLIEMKHIVTSNWERLAKEYKINSTEREYMLPAFACAIR